MCIDMLQAGWPDRFARNFLLSIEMLPAGAARASFFWNTGRVRTHRSAVKTRRGILWRIFCLFAGCCTIPIAPESGSPADAKLWRSFFMPWNEARACNIVWATITEALPILLQLLALLCRDYKTTWQDQSSINICLCICLWIVGKAYR